MSIGNEEDDTAEDDKCCARVIKCSSRNPRFDKFNRFKWKVIVFVVVVVVVVVAVVVAVVGFVLCCRKNRVSDAHDNLGEGVGRFGFSDVF